MINSGDYTNHIVKNMKPSMAFDGSTALEEWQKPARGKLKELLGLPLVKCDPQFTIVNETVCDGYTQYDFTFESEPECTVPCSLLVPADAKGPLPVAICLQGHTGGMHVSLGQVKFEIDREAVEGGSDFAVRAVKEGYCAIAMEQRYMGVRGQSEYGMASCVGSPDNAAVRTLLLGRTPIGERVWDVQCLIDLIEGQMTKWIDASRIICVGNSGGGTATFYASCVEERISLAIPSCSVCTFEASIMAMNHCPCNYIPGIRKYFNMGDLGCLIAPRPVIVVCGTEDEIFPLAGVEESYDIMCRGYESIGKSDLCRIVKGDGGHRFFPDQVWPIAKEWIGLPRK